MQINRMILLGSSQWIDTIIEEDFNPCNLDKGKKYGKVIGREI